MSEHHADEKAADYRFETHEPLDIYVENGRGSVVLTAAETHETTVAISGRGAEEVEVRLDGDQLSVVAPKQRGGFFTGERTLRVELTVPQHSSLTTKLGSADLITSGPLAHGSIRSGSGDLTIAHLTGSGLVETGSGDITLNHAESDVRLKSGSGDIRLERVDAEAAISTGSGDVSIGASSGAAVLKTGSGDLTIGHATSDVTMNSGSGDLAIGQIDVGSVRVRSASGDVRVGIPQGIPVYTEISTVTGDIRSRLQSAGQPEPGAPHVALHVKTVSGDITLRHS